MSDTIANQIQAAMGQTLSVISDTFAPSGVRLFLLRRAGETSQFTAIREVTSGYWVRWSDFRGQMQFRYAGTTDVDDDFAIATHLAYGVPNGNDEIEVFEIDAESRDMVSPDGASPFRKYYANKLRHERYTIV